MRRALITATVLAAVVTAGAATPDPADRVRPEAAAPEGSPPDGKTPDEAPLEERFWLDKLNPFAPLVKPEPAKPAEPDAPVEPEPAEPLQAFEPEPEPAEPRELKLNGILYSPEQPLAVVNDSLARPGDVVTGYRILAVETERVLAEKEGTRYLLTPLQPLARALVPVSPAPAGSAPGEDASGASPDAAAAASAEEPDDLLFLPDPREPS